MTKEDLEKLYELIYKYQILSGEDYLPDRAYVEYYKIKDELENKLDDYIEWMIEFYLKYIQNELISHNEIMADRMYSEFYDLYEKHGLDDLLEVLNEEYPEVEINEEMVGVLQEDDFDTFITEFLNQVFTEHTIDQMDITRLYDIKVEGENILDALQSLQEADQGTLQSKILAINKALNTIHDSGDMIEYIAGITKEDLTELSNMSVAEWDKDIQRLLGKGFINESFLKKAIRLIRAQGIA